MQGVVGATEHERGDNRRYRAQEVAFALARRILDTQFNTVDDKRPWLSRDWPASVGTGSSSGSRSPRATTWAI